jgi:putative transposase
MVLLQIINPSPRTGATMKYSGKGASLFQLIPRREFQELCDRFKINKKVRRLTAQKQVWALVMAFVLKLESLREIESALGIPRSTLSDASANREAQFFEELCRLVLWKIHAQLKARKVKQAIRTLLAIDSTECRVDGRLSKLEKWKTKNPGQKKASAKLHVVWNIDGEWIEEFRITSGRAHDSPAAKRLKIRASCTYVFDRAYNELTFWWSIVNQGSHFVSRLKKCSYSKWRHKKILQENPQDGVIWDGNWKPSYPVLRKAPHVPKTFTLRHIIYRDSETKKVFDFITSDFKTPAQGIADIYKKRWAVELLFRWLKGHLKIRALEVRNTNAIRIQLTIAVLVQLLIGLYRILTKDSGTLWECLRKLRMSWLKAALYPQVLKTGVFDPFAPSPATGANLKPCYP